MKASYCIDCKHHLITGECGCVLTCAKGHKPRFYRPVGRYPFYTDSGGWKRVCGNYEKDDLDQGTKLLLKVQKAIVAGKPFDDELVSDIELYLSKVEDADGAT